MSASLTQEDLANVAKLLERLCTGELNVIPGNNSPKADASVALLRRVEAYLSEGVRRMDAPIGNGGPAFPREDYQANGRADKPLGQQGMSMRDYFAAKALPALVAGEGAVNICDRDSRYNENNFAQVVAINAYEFADAMLKARRA